MWRVVECPFYTIPVKPLLRKSIAYLERFSKMTYYMSSGTLNPAHSLTHLSRVYVSKVKCQNDIVRLCELVEKLLMENSLF